MQLTNSTNFQVIEDRVQDGLSILEECAKWKHYELGSKGVSIEKSELITIGYMGLHNAAQKFDENKNNDFAGFAKYHINMAILSYQREMDGLDHRVRAQLKQINKAKQSLIQSLGHNPSTSEIAQKVNIDEEKIESLLKLGTKHVELNYDYIDRKLESGTTENDYDVREREENLGRDMNDCLDKALTNDQKKILELLYFEEKNVEEIALLLWQKLDKKEKTYIYNTTKNGKLKLKKCMAEKGWSITDV